MKQPLVSVICLCYNHAKFVAEAIHSVINQTYRNIEIIVVDDASNDASREVIQKLVSQFRVIIFLPLKKNVGNCRAFNLGLALAKGDYIIDLATDDVMMPDRIAKQVSIFQSLPLNVGVVFTDAEYVDEKGKYLRHHFEYLFRKRLLSKVPQGDVYAEVVSIYFIASPTMMIKRKVFEELKGYDEDLAYEDFDFWVRSSRLYKYVFLNESLTKIRKVGCSMSTGWYKAGDKQLHSTYLVCKKAQQLNRAAGDKQALVKRVRYELRQSVFSENGKEAMLFFKLLKELQPLRVVDYLIFNLSKLRLPLSYFRMWYHRLRFGE